MMEFIKILNAIPVIQIILLQLISFFCYALGLGENYYLSSFFQQTVAIFIPTYYFYELKNDTAYLRKKDFEIDNKQNIILFAALGFSLQLTASFVNSPIIMLFERIGLVPSGDVPVESAFDFFSAVLSICLLPSIFEETLFRKFIFNDLRMYSKNTAVLFSAVFFAISHMSFYSFGAMFFIGLVLGVLRAKEYPLIYMIICHFFLNFSAILVSLLLKSDFFNKFYYFFVLASVLAAVYSFKKLNNKAEQLEFNYYEKPHMQFINVISNPPYAIYIYIYIAVFIILGLINL